MFVDAGPGINLHHRCFVGLQVRFASERFDGVACKTVTTKNYSIPWIRDRRRVFDASAAGLAVLCGFFVSCNVDHRCDIESASAGDFPNFMRHRLWSDPILNAKVGTSPTWSTNGFLISHFYGCLCGLWHCLFYSCNRVAMGDVIWGLCFAERSSAVEATVAALKRNHENGCRFQIGNISPFSQTA